MLFVFGVGVFTSTWLGSVTMGMGEYIIRRVPLVKHIYSAAKQVSAAVSPDNEATNSFRECVIIRHPRRDGEFAFAFITGQTVLQVGAAQWAGAGVGWRATVCVCVVGWGGRGDGVCVCVWGGGWGGVGWGGGRRVVCAEGQRLRRMTACLPACAARLWSWLVAKQLPVRLSPA